MSSKTSKAFKDLDAKQLKAAADYFGTDPGEGTKDELIASLITDNISWADYVEQPVPGKPDDVVAVKDVITTGDVTPPKEDTVTVINTTNDEVLTAPAVPVLAQANYLIKMERENPYFEYGQYKFTQENPYNIMPAEDAQSILTNESGFRQAFPDELAEYYS